MGLNVWYQLTPRFALDSGIGFSSAVAKLGARLRYNFITDDFTPFVAAGLSVGTGSFGQTLYRDEARYTLGVSPYAQALAGVTYQRRSGLALMAGVGWSQLLVPRNFAWKAAPTPRQRKEMPIEVASGLLASFAVGYAF